ncbi:MAG TPA: tetratricopeptide repeat protein [Chthoniobacter sp.]|nr:tetratricopeptide repeat protein [Chthoniobacter sp.]
MRPTIPLYYVLGSALCLLSPACKPSASNQAVADPSPMAEQVAPEKHGSNQNLTEVKLARLQEQDGQNTPEALLQLGRTYLEGLGVTKDDAKAAEYFRKAADMGNAKAENNLGLMYATGQGVKKDSDEALKWLRAAATRGNIDAQENLGLMLVTGDDLPKDIKEARTWYEKAAEQGSLPSQLWLGKALFLGDSGLDKDYVAAARWLMPAAEKGDAWAQNAMGMIYERPLGVKRDVKGAEKWFVLAAEQGDVKAQANLGLLIFSNTGLPVDKVAGYKWLALASEHDEATAFNALKEIVLGLSPEVIAEGRRQVEEYKAKHQLPAKDSTSAAAQTLPTTRE